MDHLLLHCHVAKDLWDMQLCLLGVSWVMPYSVCAMLDSWRGIDGKGKDRGVVGIALLPDVVHLEGEKSRTFDGNEYSLPHLKFLFLRVLNECSKSSTFSTYSFKDFLAEFIFTS